MPVPYHEYSSSTTTTTTHTPPPSSSPSKWGPYTGAGDFTANMVIILLIIFCALVLALAVNAVVRYLLCSFRHPQPSDPEKCSDRKAQSPAAESLPTLLFSAAATKLAGTEAECAICLAEFADGDRVRVLPACNHGFHVSCIEKWLVTRKSCPTCRASCHVVEEV